MAAPQDNREYAPGDAIFIAALLLSMALHAVVLYFMPKAENNERPQPEMLTVELQAPPKPLPPPEPPKKPVPKPEKEKPKPQPKKPLPPPPKPQAAPHVESPIPQTHQEPEPAKPSQPPVIAVPPPPVAEPPHEFVAPQPQPEPPRPKGPSEQDLDNARGNYSNLLSREFAKYKQYPRIAQMRGWQGTVKVELHLDANGNVRSSTINESSNFDVLDKQALEMVRKASPLPQPPEVLRGREFTIIVPVVFKLE